MFVQLTRLLLLLLLGTIIFRLWKLLVSKEGNLVSRLWFLLAVFLLLIAFTAPDSPVGLSILSLLSVFVLPLGLSILLLILAATQINKGGIASPGPNLILTALLILILSSMPFVAEWLAFQLEKNAIETVQKNLCCGERAEAIVLLGSGTTEPKLPYATQVQLTRIGARIPYTSKLYKDGLAPLVIVSAGSQNEYLQPIIEADSIAKLLREMGVPSSAIIKDTSEGTLHDSAVAIQEIAKDYNLGRAIILVTSALEMRRASLTFANVGFKVIPAPTNFYASLPNEKFQERVSAKDFLPSTEALLITTDVVEEYIITFYYFIRGWLAPSI
ncbi:MAG: YdcF family protein [Cyanobacteria bacterium J06592_8]